MAFLFFRLPFEALGIPQNPRISPTMTAKMTRTKTSSAAQFSLVFWLVFFFVFFYLFSFFFMSVPHEKTFVFVSELLGPCNPGESSPFALYLVLFVWLFPPSENLKFANL